ncbi:MAG: hypothetical protein HQL70_11605 [Magnetococcales bacterium]|nr:hypothetical protein [Magnetococcales bacterium]
MPGTYVVNNATSTTDIAVDSNEIDMAAGDLFVIKSDGPDRSLAASGTDNILLTVTVQEFQAFLMQDGSMKSLAATYEADAQAEIKILNEAAKRLNDYLIKYVDNYPMVNTPGCGSNSTESATGAPLDGLDSCTDDDGISSTSNIYLDPNNSAAPNIDQMIGYALLDSNNETSSAAVDILRLNGYIQNNTQVYQDYWNNNYLWDTTSHQFFSRGPILSPAATVECFDGNDISATTTSGSFGTSTGCAGTN